MHKLRIKTTSIILAALVLCCAVLGGCQVKRPAAPSAPETASGAAGTESTGSQEQVKAQALKEQERFQKEMEELFCSEISETQVNMHFMLKDPSRFGISKAKNLYPSLAPEKLEEARQSQQELKELLDTFDPALLTESQRLTLQILDSYLATEKRTQGLELYYQPLAVTIGVQAQLPILLAEYEFRGKQDVEEYLELVAGIDEYYQDIMDFEKRKAEAGLMMSDRTIDHVIESCESFLLVPGDNFMTQTFDTRLEQVAGLTEEEKAGYRQLHAQALEQHFLPAYQLLIDGLTALKGTGTNEGGQCGYPRGKEYYEYQVYAATGTSCPSVDELLKDVERTMEDGLISTSLLLRKYPELIHEVDSYAFRQTEPEGIMEELKTLTQEDYPALPACSYTFKMVPKALELSLSPAFYLVSPLDDYENNTIYINGNPQFAGSDLYTVIAHEGYPGHLYQNVYFNTQNHDNVRKLISFPGYSEGWATYVERESYIMDNGLRPEMGQLLADNYIAALGLHACLDIYINYKGWTREQVKEYLQRYYNQPDSAVESLYDAMVENPANYLSYFVGCMEIRNMREEAESRLGNRFDLKEFHKFILDMGDAPFDVIRGYFGEWMKGQEMGSGK